MLDKIKTLAEIAPCLDEERKKGFKIVQCHGVFDLLHPGHIRHFQEARGQGDKLVVSLTPDRFVNKGPGRPAFGELLRLEQIASLSCVDYVVLNDSPDAVSIIKKIRPSIYVKGLEYKNHADDVTGKISEEQRAIEEVGGKIHYTDDIVFSSSSLINRFFDSDQQRILPFIEKVRSQLTLKEILEKIEELSKLNVLIVGDAIIDEYQYVHPLGQSGKGVHMTARCLDKETFLGGSLIISGHVASFAGNVTLLTAVGKNCPYSNFMDKHIPSKVKKEFIYLDEYPTLLKKRYVLKDGETITKLFETYSSNDQLLRDEQTEKVVSYIDKKAKEYDLVLVCDFGNGFTNPAIIDALSQVPSFLAINTQTNSGNRGYNVVTHYHRADFISLNEPELRLAAQDRHSSLDFIVSDISEILDCTEISVTRGVNGVFFYSKGGNVNIPALTTRAVDRVGAGDSYFSLSAMGASLGFPPILSGFLGSIAAAIDVQIVGNKEAVDKVALCKYVTRLMK